MNTTLRRAYIDELTEWWKYKFPQTEYKHFIVSVMFNNIGGKEEYVLHRMEIEINDFYRKLSTRLNRKPNSHNTRSFVPQFVFYPDLPVPKSNKSGSTKTDIANNGLHYHAICAIPRISRLKEDITQHIKANKTLYFPTLGLINRIHFEEITSNHGLVSRYVFKQFKMKRFDPTHFIYLPKCATEMPS